MKKYEEKNLNPEIREKVVKVISDFANEDGTQPEIEIKEDAPLFLFDIDGTLVDIRPIHGQTLVRRYLESVPEDQRFQDSAFQEEFSQAFYKTFGKGLRHPQQDILRDQFKIPASDKQLDRVIEGYGRVFSQILNQSTPEERQKYILPGVLHILENLRRNKIPCAIVTGNTKESAEAIMKSFGFSKYFVTGGYADEVPSDPGKESKRAYILQATLKRLKEKGLDFENNEKIAIGDTPSDSGATVWQGKKIAKAFLVSTGDFSLKDLDHAEVSGDLVLPEIALSGNIEKDQELLRRITEKK